jgi:photosystem II stability/assembly factor-like uncharacterized protein
MKNTLVVAALALGMMLVVVGRAADVATAPAQPASAVTPGVVDVSAGLPINLRVLAAVPGKDKVVAFCGKDFGPATGWCTTDGGATWKQLNQGAGAAKLTMLPLGTLMDPEHPDTFWVFGNWAAGTGGVRQTTDGGDTFVGFPYGEADGFSVDFSDPKRQTMVMGEHEHSQAVGKSVDGGKTWAAIGKALPAGTWRSEVPLVIDAQTYLIGCSFTVPYGPKFSGEGTPGIYRTTDGGKTWAQVSEATVFRNPLVVGDKIYWSVYNKAKDDGGIIMSADKGLTWKTVTPGGLNHTVIPMALPGGKLAALKKTKFITISADGGVTWTDVNPALTLKNPEGVTYNAPRKAFFAWQIGGAAQRLDVP